MTPQVRLDADERSQFIQVRQQGHTYDRVVPLSVNPLLDLRPHDVGWWQSHHACQHPRRPPTLHLDDGKDRSMRATDADKPQRWMVRRKYETIEPTPGLRPRPEVRQQEWKIEVVPGGEDDNIRSQ